MAQTTKNDWDTVPPPITVILGFFMNDSLSPYVDPYHDVFH